MSHLFEDCKVKIKINLRQTINNHVHHTVPAYQMLYMYMTFQQPRDRDAIPDRSVVLALQQRELS